MNARHAALGLVAILPLTSCHSNSDNDRDYTSSSRTQSSNYSGQYADRASEQRSYDASRSDSPETRILSVLHFKNQKELEIGHMAHEMGSSEAARRFGDRLVSDHTENDRQVMSVANKAGVTLMSQTEVEQYIHQRQGTMEGRDPADELRSLQGSEFDRAFAQMMHDGHRALISMVEDARNDVHDQSVRAFLDRALPTLREHQREADNLMNQ